MSIFKKRGSGKIATPVTQPKNSHPFTALDGYVPLGTAQNRLYYSLREAVPVIDAAIFKIVRLTGGFTVRCRGNEAQKALDNFLLTVPVGGNRQGINSFTESYLEQLLTCGTAVGEIVTDISGRPAALYNASLDNIEFRRAEDNFNIDIYVRDVGDAVKIPRPELCLVSVLNPEPGSLTGSSMLKGLPFVSNILLKIYESIGQNWERAGNLRFAVTYNPKNDSTEKAFARERAAQIAEEWSSAMRNGRETRDFVAVGDVQIKAIGADSQIMDSEVPVRQMLEQIVAKTGLPPFMLGLSWSTTERMSTQQADALTSELEAYRRILTPVIMKIASTYLSSMGYRPDVNVEWDDITLQDEVEQSKAMLYRAQAEKINKEIW
jgi:hypothetical protein